jgi:Fe-S cluster assembly scaffold protein SufB
MKTYTIGKNQKETIKITESGDYLIELIGQGAEAEIFGAFLAEQKQNIEINVTINHKAKNTLANTTLRGVARDQSKIRFFGRIIINKNCGMSNSFLTERVLLLSDQASAEAVPELEILTDDVKCSHAASISQIPEQQLFYIMSRGISKKKAEDLIIEGFLQI